MANIWNLLKHFNENENWGSPEKMNGALLLLLDQVRDMWSKPFVIHCGFATAGHMLKSQHYLGNAVDFHIQTELPFSKQIDKTLKVLDDLQVADRVGLGIYPDWAHPGFHLDLRGYKARWGRLKDVYVSFEEAYKKS